MWTACKPCNKGPTSSTGMWEAVAGCRKTELWLQKSFCCLWSNFHTYIPWSEGCVLSILYSTLCSKHTRKSLLYMWTCSCGFWCFWVTLLNYSDKMMSALDRCWICILISRSFIARIYEWADAVLSAFEDHVERYTRTVCKKSWANLRAYLRDWKKQYWDWNEGRSIFSMFFIVYYLKFKSGFLLPFPSFVQWKVRDI